MSKTVLTPDQLARVAHLSSRKAAEELGVGKSTINDARAKTGTPRKPGSSKAATFEDKGNGSLIIESTDAVPQTADDIHARMRSRGFDPDKYTFTYRFSEREAQTADGVQTLYAARAGAVEKKSSLASVLSTEDLEAILAAYVAPEIVEVDPEVFEPNTFVFNFADPQIGKTDINGGTEETVVRFLNSLAHAEDLLTAEPATEIIWSDLGDGIENFCNTSSQRQTNDRNLVEQVRILRRLQLEGLLRLSRFAPIKHVSVPSNHSQNRVGMQAPASTSHDDWGLEVQSQLSEMFAMPGAITGGHPITFLQPDPHMESVAYETSDGTKLGFVHGHRSNSQDGLERWWAGQSLGRQPTADADILLVGHFHNYSVRSVGKERYIITVPSLDNGSSWFTVSRGNVSTAGVGTMRVNGGKMRDWIIV